MVQRQIDPESAPNFSSEETPLVSAETDNKAGVGSIILILLLGVFVSNADGSLVLATYGEISSEFNDLAGSGWIMTSYMIAGCATQALYGKLSDIFGRKNTLLTAYSLFTIGLAICGSSKTLWQFITGRIISGCGGSGMTVLVSIIITDLVPIKEVALWRSYVNIAATIGRSLGGPLGGLMADAIGWRWSFFGQCPLAALAILLVLSKYSPSVVKYETAREKLARIDFLGAISMCSTTVFLLLVVEKAKGPSKSTLFLYLALTIFSGAFFFRTEATAKEPVFPPRLLAQRGVITAYAIGTFQLAAQLGMMFSVPIYFQLTQNASTSRAGAQLVPAVVGNAVGGILCGIFINRTGRYKAITIVGTIASGISYTLMLIRWRGHTSFWESLYILPGGLGTGIALSSTFIALTAAVSKSEIAIAGAGLYMTNGLGGILGLSAVSAVMQKVLLANLDSTLDGYEDKEEIISNAISNLDYVRHLEGAVHDLVLKAYIKSLESTHVVSLAFSLLASIAALCMIQVKLT